MTKTQEPVSSLPPLPTCAFAPEDASSPRRARASRAFVSHWRSAAFRGASASAYWPTRRRACAARPEPADGEAEFGDHQPLFENPFTLRDVLIFDAGTLRDLYAHDQLGVAVAALEAATRGGPPALRRRLLRVMSSADRTAFARARERALRPGQAEAARRRLLDALFWELTYWRTPELYEDLTAGEQIHPEVWRRLTPDVRGSVVLDAGAGSGRATFAMLRLGARQVEAVEPSPGLLKLLDGKVQRAHAERQVILRPGRFDALPLADASVDLALSCSAFTAERGQGGEVGLAELQRVTRSGGKVVLIWPRQEDRAWLSAHGFVYESVAGSGEMGVRFSSLATAMRCARRFYAHNPRVLRYLLRTRRAYVPFSVLGFNPPRDYCWLRVER